ncbi:hypothetical protein JZO70_16820 [Enterococcus sp. 669A]|uniref:MucBP domain-containing protein n=1 Tax=Candidatus Enterococcus moelleringii TaxID=2815325 RepID=A0ABS3LDZ5_9ENTE|nr:hypothetical protein [Enterococcus sp. 669A]MBO1307840.1 hypothetical protein [Enterococcus sp. 669A]
MEKGMKQRKKKILKRSLIVSILTLLVAGVGYYSFQSEEKPTEKIEAAKKETTVETHGDFELTVKNSWDNTDKKSYAQLKWDGVPESAQSEYTLYQSVEGKKWGNPSSATENVTSDYSVKDVKAPDKPTVEASDGKLNKLDVRINAKDNGTNYGWYVEANTDTGSLASQTIEEEIISNTAGYFYRIVSDPNSTNFKEEIENKKDEHGQIPEGLLDEKVAPDYSSVVYSTDAKISIDKEADAEKHLQVIAVDRMSNVSEVETVAVADLLPPVEFEVERTADEAKLVEINLQPEMDQGMEVIFIRTPKNLALNPITLPTSWEQYQIINGATHNSIVYTMGNNNSSASIQQFLESLRFTIGNPVNQSGEIEVLFYKTLRNTVEVIKDNYLEYFSLITESGMGVNDSHYDPATGIFTYTQNLMWRQGGFYLKNRISFEDDFRLEGRANLGDKVGIPGPNGGADGIGFLLHPGSASALGQAGGSLGVGGIPNGFGFVLDSYYNQELTTYYYPDPAVFINKTHGGFVKNEGAYGAKNTYMGPDAPAKQIPDPQNNMFRDFVIEYKHATHTLSAKYDNDDNLAWEKDISGWLLAGVDSYAFSSQGSTGTYFNLQQFQLEKFKFSEVVEYTEESKGDISFSAAIPQKVSLKAYDDKGTPLPEGDIFEDQELRIGKAVTQPKEIEFYSFIEAREMNDVPRDKYYNVSNTYQEGKLIYSFRRADLHVRQVIQGPNDELVVPKEGYLTIQNQLHNDGSPVLDTNYQINTTVSSGKEVDNPGFTRVVLSTSHLMNDNDEVLLSAIIPEFYKYNGYRISDTLASHGIAPVLTDAKISLSRLGIYNQGERWITIYLEPNGTNDGKPQPYSWDYKKNDLGKIKTK